MFFYFLPESATNGRPIDRELLQSIGLDDVFRDVKQSEWAANRLPGSGPGGHGGTLLTAPRVDGVVPERFGYYPNSQTWAELNGYWLGFDDEHRPTAETLRRKTRLIDGNRVELGDGTEWVAPLIRAPLEGVHYLPATLGVDADGAPIDTVVPEHVDHWVMAGEMFDHYIGKLDMTPADEFRYAVRCLAINYRLGPHECTALGLLTTNNLPLVFGAAFDRERVDEFVRDAAAKAGEAFPEDDAPENEKKNGDAASSGEPLNTTGGPPATDVSPATVPPTATSTCSAKGPDAATPSPSSASL